MLLPIHWQVKPHPGVSARPLAGGVGFWSLAAGPRDPRAFFRSLQGEGVPDAAGCLEVCFGLLVGRSSWSQGRVGPVLWYHSFVSGVCPLVVEAGLEACAGFLAGQACTCPLVGEAGSWPSDGLGYV